MSDGIMFLGQVGILLRFEGFHLLVDPYLSDSVADMFGDAFRRLAPPPFTPLEAPPVDHVLLTHAHMDHTDPETLVPLLRKQPDLSLTAPYEAAQILGGLGAKILLPVPDQWTPLTDRIRIKGIPAAHTELETDAEGTWRSCGYLIDAGGTIIYHAGDTIPHPSIFESLTGERIDLALLPVNERNYYRDAQGIIGNMSLREAFRMTEQLGATTLIPTHWDLFAPNRVHRREIELLYELENPSFRLKILEAGESLTLAS